MTTCRFVATDQPRILPGQHTDDCTNPDTCRGCAPCMEQHCAVCDRVHVDGTCAECVGHARDDLRTIARLCDALPDEVRHRGINGEAMMLLGPAADPEARQHVEASYLAGRLPEGWIEATHGRHCPRLANEPCVGCAGGERHPLFVLGTWDMIWRDALGHDEPDDRVSIATAVDYLDTQLTYMAGQDEPPFEDFARDLRGCRSHLQAVLADRNHGDPANIGCFDCGGQLERRLTERGFEDWWTCQRCRRKYTQAEYNFALRAALEEDSA